MIDGLTEPEREYLREMRALAVGPDGVEHLVGLTLDETIFYVRFSLEPVSGDFPSRTDSERYLGLQRRHETSRLAVISEDSLMNRKSPSLP